MMTPQPAGRCGAARGAATRSMYAPPTAGGMARLDGITAQASGLRKINFRLQWPATKQCRPPSPYCS